jgi:hypothetical protein
VRIANVYATRWRRSSIELDKTGAESELDQRLETFDLVKRLATFSRLFGGQLPVVLDGVRVTGAEVTLGQTVPAEKVTSAELLIFALPFPADQVVAALVLDFDSPDLNQDSSLTQTILKSCVDAEVRIDHVDLATWVDHLAAGAKAEEVTSPGQADRRGGLPTERHHIVVVGELGGADPPGDNMIKQLLLGIEPPYRPEFTELKRPVGLNQEDDAFGAVSPTISFLYGHPDDVENSVFLTTVQAVGTASRFQQIWQAAYHHIREFQANKQAEQSGIQKRGDLESLADEMGNLELDLAFSVETAADLGLRIPSSRIDSFHRDLYEVMQIRTQASTVSQMFVRLGGSIRSEITAIESRERQQEEERRLRVAVALGVVTCLAAPLTFFIGFFGMNATQVHASSSMWDWGEYHWTYVAAIALALIPVVAFFFLHGRMLVRKHREGRAKRAQASRPSQHGVGQQEIVPSVRSSRARVG